MNNPEPFYRSDQYCISLINDYLSHINFSFFFTVRKITMLVVSHILVIYLTLNSENIIIAH